MSKKKYSEEKCDLAKSVEMEVCYTPVCKKCTNFDTPCLGVNEECVDTDESIACLCKKPFLRDEFGDCKKCGALRPFAWQCESGECFQNGHF